MKPNNNKMKTKKKKQNEKSLFDLHKEIKMDKYGKEIEEIKKELETNEGVIRDHWEKTTPLFSFVTNFNQDTFSFMSCGCLTLIRRLDNVFAFCDGEKDLKLTAEIKADERIPKQVDKIILSDLAVFAEWQRKIDKLYNRTD